jgi:hypothetical protein
MKAGLIDEYQLLLYPVVLGKGRPEFKDLDERYPLSLIDVQQFKSGAVKLVYQPRREVRPRALSAHGSSAAPQLSVLCYSGSTYLRLE